MIVRRCLWCSAVVGLLAVGCADGPTQQRSEFPARRVRSGANAEPALTLTLAPVDRRQFVLDAADTLRRSPAHARTGDLKFNALMNSTDLAFNFAWGAELVAHLVAAAGPVERTTGSTEAAVQAAVADVVLEPADHPGRVRLRLVIRATPGAGELWRFEDEFTPVMAP